MSEDEDAARSRLIGESDVLAAVTSEYLDENASKKDTSAATVCLGRVFMTTFRFQFVPNELDVDHVRRHLLDRSDDDVDSFFLIPLGCIASIKKKNLIVEIVTKDLRQLLFRFDAVEVTKVRDKAHVCTFMGTILTLRCALWHVCRSSPC